MQLQSQRGTLSFEMCLAPHILSKRAKNCLVPTFTHWARYLSNNTITHWARYLSINTITHWARYLSINTITHWARYLSINTITHWARYLSINTITHWAGIYPSIQSLMGKVSIHQYNHSWARYLSINTITHWACTDTCSIMYISLSSALHTNRGIQLIIRVLCGGFSTVVLYCDTKLHSLISE